MSIVYSVLAPLFRWASYGFKEGDSSARVARTFKPKWLPFQRSRKKKDDVLPASAVDHPFQLKWPERHSFFDPAVQEVMQERHPGRGSCEKGGFKGYPVDAWRVVDQFARTAGSSERSLAEFGVFMRLDPVWISKLLSAVAQSNERRTHDSVRGPDSLAAENRRREQIMHRWAECWVAHYRFPDSEAA